MGMTFVVSSTEFPFTDTFTVTGAGNKFTHANGIYNLNVDKSYSTRKVRTSEIDSDKYPRTRKFHYNHHNNDYSLDKQYYLILVITEKSRESSCWRIEVRGPAYRCEYF